MSQDRTSAEFEFDEAEAKGTVTFERGRYGVNIFVNGIGVGFIDLCPCVEGHPAQIILDGGSDDEPLAKLVIVGSGEYCKGDSVLVVNGNAVQMSGPFEYATHSDNRDHLFRW